MFTVEARLSIHRTTRGGSRQTRASTSKLRLTCSMQGQPRIPNKITEARKPTTKGSNRRGESKKICVLGSGKNSAFPSLVISFQLLVQGSEVWRHCDQGRPSFFTLQLRCSARGGGLYVFITWRAQGGLVVSMLHLSNKGNAGATTR